MKINDFEQSAWTPELGGELQDIKLKIKACLPAEQRQYNKNLLLFRDDKEKNQRVPIFDTEKFTKDFDGRTVALVEDWENFESAATGEKIPCNEENKRKWLLNWADKKTGHDVEISRENKKTGEIETVTEKGALFIYIQKFASDIKNFEKNS